MTLKSLLPLFLIFTFIPTAPSLAASRVIRDNRIMELGITPALGRGYSFANNTIQSLCFKKVVTTVPTYDLEYDFQEIDKTYMNQTTITTKLENAYLNSFLKKHVVFEEKGRGEGNAIKEYKVKNLLAHIKVSSYYYSLDESRSELSDAARELLNKGDIVNFYNACGPYYLRSLGRYASFMALFKFRVSSGEEETDEDIVFQNELQRRISRLYRIRDRGDDFTREQEERVLRINIQAVGLGKGEMINLIPTDLKEFKKTIEGAVQLMQNPDSGVITSMEITPWSDNTDFQINLQIPEEERRIRFQERKNLEDNSGIISEIGRIDQTLMDQYYKALNCHRILKEEYKVGDGEFEYDPKRTFFYDLANKTNPKQYKTLEELLSHINEKSVEDLYKENNHFLYGKNDNDHDGALFCIDEIERQGIMNVNYRAIPACRQIMKYRPPYLPIIDHYCLPEQANVIVKPIIRRPIPIPPRLPRPTPQPPRPTPTPPSEPEPEPEPQPRPTPDPRPIPPRPVPRPLPGGPTLPR